MKIKEHASHLQLVWPDGQTHDFLYFWLYDNAPINWFENGQKRTDSRLVPVDIRPVSLRFTEDCLYIIWFEEEIAYPFDYLRRYIPKQAQSPKTYPQHNAHRIFYYKDLLNNPTILLSCLKDIKTYGFTRIAGVPHQDGIVLQLVSLFGYVRETNYGKYYKVIATPNPDNLADSALGLAPHTDNPYRNPTPSIQVLHCLTAAKAGGESILVDGFYLAEKVREENPEYFKLLSTIPVAFQFKNARHHLYNESPIISLDTMGKLKALKFNNRSIQPFQLDNAILPAYFKAYQHFEKLIHQEAFQTRFLLEEGQAIIYDNERMLHGRTAYQADSERHLQGCYADRDALYSTIRTLEEGATIVPIGPQ